MMLFLNKTWEAIKKYWYLVVGAFVAAFTLVLFRKRQEANELDGIEKARKVNEELTRAIVQAQKEERDAKADILNKRDTKLNDINVEYATSLNKLEDKKEGEVTRLSDSSVEELADELKKAMSRF